MIDYKLLGRRVAILRKQLGLTQEKLAEKAGISNNYLSNIENCYSIPSLETFMNICLALKTTPDNLLLGTNSNENNYLESDLIRKINTCNPKEKRIINGIIDTIISER